ncbi:MAG: methyltransferase domain-containing protein [Deltaproteobacteria bacterium]|nr:methyltransferase domain-containing protein [Deltaproteobacteria bacterium]
MLTRFIAKQLGDPSGPFGRLVMSRLLNRGNDELISATLTALELEPGDRYLDVGFGGGVSFEKAARVVTGKMLGVDPSQDMVDSPSTALTALIHAGRLELKLGDVAAIPVARGSIDKLLTTNTVYFWPDLDAGLRGSLEPLAPGGRLAIGLTQRKKMKQFAFTEHGFTKYEASELVAPLEAAGFERIHVHRLYSRVTEGDAVVTAHKPL